MALLGSTQRLTLYLALLARTLKLLLDALPLSLEPRLGLGKRLLGLAHPTLSLRLGALNLLPSLAQLLLELGHPGLQHTVALLGSLSA